ncbi:TPA: TolC family protein [Vibrio vulnificus]|uniref:Heavy metal RND efflux outer membrane protein, CzcC family n=2 Tax=Vibrio vulnificus TaxID=672 RepID=A0A3Q0KZ00_VIBVU|nr:TolC family protein [Vibrio vulnificus]AAO07773.1 Heavy metal RND efflux outer membrane protein, CzcC family [Vibrio vulnificus CMCP6]EGQ8092524.1 TolC family protein [Vibrio vulnificus]EGR0104861.1 TolC family protein [Vibrio vulnificus]EHH0745617.1 TolC family protein [Vibrio vulnificus]EJR3609354.1 TolC family protein [Vibrio vulnificus]
MKPSLLALCISVSALVATPVMAQSSTAPTGQLLSQSDPLTLLIEQALANDASRKQIFAQSQAMRESGVAASTLMDPKLKVGFGGLPVDSFKFDEDPMTNISVGLMQQFERGSTLELQSKKASQQADGMALQVAAREREVANGITQLWLELGYQQQAERVLLENQRLMRELESFISTNYSIGKSEAQDLLNAQLQVSQLEEKLQANQQMQRRILSQMSEWLGSEWLYQQRDLKASNQLNWDALERLLSASSTTQHFAQLAQHPMVQMANANIAVSQTQVELAEQSYTPQFGVEVMYAYRQANNMKGEPASDLVSAYLTMDIPLFTGNRQDRAHAAAQYQVGAAQSQKDLLLAQMNAKVNALLVDRSNLEQRLERYQNTLLEQAKARTKAVERGYQNSTAQFNDVIAATRDELAVELESQRLLTDLNQVNSNLAMLLGGFTYTVAQPELADIDVNRR